MKNIFLHLSFFLLIFNSCLLSQDKLPFDLMYMTTDLTGLVSNNNTILTYGNYGIILASKDNGITWNQQTIGNAYNIKKIIRSGNEFYGFASNIIFKSNDSGTTWKLSSVFKDTLLDICIDNDIIYLLSNHSVMTLNVNLNIINNSIITLNQNNYANEFLVLDNKIFLPIDFGKIIKYNISSSISDTINFKKLNLCDSCFKPTSMKYIDNVLYIKMNDTIYNSKDFGLTWMALTSTFGVYNVFNSQIYSLEYSYNPIDKLKVADIDYMKCSSNFINTKLNSNIGKRQIAKYDFTYFIFINKDTIIAVGKNKLIATSFNRGLDWDIKSFIDFSQNGFTKFVNAKIGYFISSNDIRSIYKTIDSCVTWKPQFYDDKFNKILKLNYLNSFYFDTNGNGFLYLSQNSTFVDINKIVTKDFGETYEFSIDSLMREGDLNTQSLTTKSKGNLFTIVNSGFYNNRYSLQYSFKDGKPLQFITYDSLQFIKIFNDENDDLYAVTHHRRNPTLGIGGKFNLEYYELVKSIDGGRNWDKLNNININSDFTRLALFKNHFLITEDYGIPSSIEIDSLGNSIMKSGYSLDSLYLYNINLNLRENILGSKKYNRINSDYYLLNDRMYLFGLDTIYENTNIISKPKDWKIHKGITKTILNILFSQPNSVAYFQSASFGKPNNNLIKLTPNSSNSSIESQSEDQTYFYSYPPYPIPAFNEVKSLIYWDMSFDIDASEINVFDVFGNKIDDKSNIKINKLNSYSGYLTWDCSKATSGVYMIQLKHENKTIYISVMVVR